eukprot:2793119-Amphidinium_carterae.1
MLPSFSTLCVLRMILAANPLVWEASISMIGFLLDGASLANLDTRHRLSQTTDVGRTVHGKSHVMDVQWLEVHLKMGHSVPTHSRFLGNAVGLGDAGQLIVALLVMARFGHAHQVLNGAAACREQERARNLRSAYGEFHCTLRQYVFRSDF